MYLVKFVLCFFVFQLSLLDFDLKEIKQECHSAGWDQLVEYFLSIYEALVSTTTTK